MDVDVFTLCDAATVEAGKLNLLGAFDALWGTAFPLHQPQCAVALKLRFPPEENGAHQLVLQFRNPDGQEVLPPLKGDINIDIPPGRPHATANLVFNIQRVAFGSPGRYTIHLTLDGSPVKTIPLLINRRTLNA